MMTDNASKKQFPKAVFLLLLPPMVLLAYLYAQPYITIYRIKTAIDRLDSEALSRHIDFIQLRGNMKTQIAKMINVPPLEKGGRSPLDASNNGFRNQISDQLVEQMVTPERLPLLIAQGLSTHDINAAPGGEKQMTPEKFPEVLKNTFHKAQFGYQSVSRFAVIVAVEKQRTIRFIMTREGLRWKLSNIEVQD